jgi:molecular chaperone DnaK
MAPDEIDIWGRWAAPGARSGGEERPFTVTDNSNSPRDSTRVPLAHRIQLKFDRFSGFIGEYVSNLSPGGIFIRTEAPEEPGQILEFEFRLGDGFELIRGRGEVVWARQVAEGTDRPKGMGVRFLELSPGSKDLIYKIVDDFVAHGGKPFDLTPPPARPLDPSMDATIPLTAPAPPPGAQPLATSKAEASAPRPPHPTQLTAPVPPPLPIEPRPLDSVPPPRPPRPTPLPPRLDDPRVAPPRQAIPAPSHQPGDPPPPPTVPPLPPPPPLQWSLESLELPAIRPVPGVPVITPRSPLELLGAPPAASSSLPADPGGGETAPAGRPAPAAIPGRSPAEGASRKPAIDPLEQMLAALPPLDDLAPARPASAPSPPAAPTSVPAPPALPFSAFDLSAPRRRSRLPMIGAVLVIALLGAGVFLLRDTLLGWVNGKESAAPPAVPPHGAAPRPLHALAVPGGSAPAGAQPPASQAPAPGSGALGPAATGSTPPPGSRAFGPRLPVSDSAGKTPAPPASAADRSSGAAGSPAVPAAGRSGEAQRSAGKPGTPVPADGAAPGLAAAPPPLVSARPAAAAAAATPAGARLTALERITWEATRGGTDVVLWGNGDFTPQSFTRSRVGGIAGLPAREVVRLVGITRPFPQSKIAVATAAVSQIRIGSHPHDELHVVIDLASRDVKVGDVEIGPHQLRLHLTTH